ncbi:MAG: serine/threonine-protein kinase [Planctomycetota bacterium]
MPHLHLDDFDLGAVLGVGTVGTIYDSHVREDDVSPAAETLRGLNLAIKKLHPAVSSDELIQARFRREMLVLERLKHPNIVSYYGGGKDDGAMFYVMERVDGGTMKDLLESSGAMAWPVVVDVARQISSALQCAHNHGVIHRDLKPGNLFLTRDATVKLGDFGIARDLHSAELTNQGLTVGTHAYMAPEQITGDENISGKADLYALGCCLFEFLTRRKVFQGENFAQLFEQHLRVMPPAVTQFVGDAPSELSDVIAQCLAKNPEDRPFNARAVQGAMLEIGRKYHLQATSTVITPLGSETDTSNKAGNAGQPSGQDVSADSVTEKGRQLLEKQIEARFGGQAREPLSWSILALIIVTLLAIVMIAALAGGR